MLDAWKARNPNVVRVVAYTTRPPRAHEQDGVDYHFVSDDEFMNHVVSGDFLEYKEVHGHKYATPLNDMEDLLRNGKVAVLKIDVQGAIMVMNLRPDAETVFLLPPDADELERRITGRGTEDESSILTRLKNAQGEIQQAEKYRHRLINDVVDKTVDELEAIVGAKQA